MTLFLLSRSIVVLSIVILALSVPPVDAQDGSDSENIDVVGRWAQGPSRAVAAQGDFAYFGNGAYLQITDFSNSSEPAMQGRVLLPDLPSDITLAGNYAYVADGSGGLRVIDVADPSSPQEIGAFETADVSGELTEGGYAGVAVAGDYAYVADEWVTDGFGGLRTFNVSDPTDPQEAGALDSDSSPQDVTVVGDYAYVALGTIVGGGLWVVDISNPAAPQSAGIWESDEAATDVSVMGDYAYVANGEAGMQVLDISTPAAPALVASFAPGDDVWDLTVADDRAYLAHASLSEGAGLYVVDISDPTSPQEAGSFATTSNVSAEGDALDVAVGDGLAYVAYATLVGTGLRAIDVSSVTALQEAARTITADGAAGSTFSGDYAYVATGRTGLHVLDVSDLTAPQEVATFDAGMATRYVVAAGNHVVVADPFGDALILDVSDPTAPQQVSTFETGGDAEDMALQDGYLYIPTEDSGLRVFDVSDAANPQEVGTFETDEASAVAIVGDRAYVAADDAGLIVIDISDPTSLQEIVTHVPAEGRVSHVAVKGDYAYITADNALRIIDISNLNAPEEVGDLFVSNVYHMAVDGGLAYLSRGNSGLEVIDVSDPTDPQQTGFLDTPHFAQGVTLTGGYIYLMDSDDGVYILEYTGAGGTAVEEGPERTDSPTLSPLHPSPFTTQVQFTMSVPQSQHVRVAVYDVLGRRVVTLHDGTLAAGRQQHFVIEGAGLPSGPYFVRVTGERFSTTRSVVRAR